MTNYDGLLPEIPDDHNKIIDFNCSPGNSHQERSIIMKLGDALLLCIGDGKWNQKLIGQIITE